MYNPVLYVLLIMLSCFQCGGEEGSLEIRSIDNGTVRFFFTKRIIPINNYQYVKFIFTNEIPVPDDINEQLKTIDYHNKGVYKVFYDPQSRIRKYEYLKRGKVVMRVIFEYENGKNHDSKLKTLKYYGESSRLVAIERIFYNNFGVRAKMERYIMPGYYKSQLY